MPRDIKKLTELQQLINKKDLEIAKYKQLVKNIQAIITINGVKPSEDDYIDLLAGESIGQDRKAATYQLSTEELGEAFTSRLKKEGKRVLTNGNNLVIVNKDDKGVDDFIKKEHAKATADEIKKAGEAKKCLNCQQIGH
jgi:hypothetical protein